MDEIIDLTGLESDSKRIAQKLGFILDKFKPEEVKVKKKKNANHRNRSTGEGTGFDGNCNELLSKNKNYIEAKSKQTLDDKAFNENLSGIITALFSPFSIAY